MRKDMIVLWSGTVKSIPSGYFLCDGTHNTPDLRNQFIIGAGDTFAVGDTGGIINHNHDATLLTHFHAIPAGAGRSAGVGWDNATDSKQSTGISDTKSLLPAYYALAFIMRRYG